MIPGLPRSVFCNTHQEQREEAEQHMSPNPLVFVMDFAVFPTAILLGQPAGETRTIAIAAYQMAFEHYDMPKASSIAMIMSMTQMIGLVIILALRRRLYRGTSLGITKGGVTVTGPMMVLLHAYKKKGQKAPVKEIETAIRRMKEVLHEP